MPHRPRSAILAACLGLIAPGLGHLYLGQARRFGVPAIIFLAGVLVLGLAELLSTFVGMAAYLVAAATLYLYAIVHPVVVARRLETFAPKWYNTWYGYVGWVALIAAFSLVMPEIRESVLGYSTLRVPTAVMSPTIQPRDIVLVDTHAFRSHEPAPGEVVIVRGPRTGTLFIRRVSPSTTPLAFSFIIDNPAAPVAEPVAELASVPASQIIGRVTYVLYSPAVQRIGLRVK